MTTAIAAAMLATTVLYENDFATRRSEEAPHSSVWAIYEYDKGGPVAYDYVYGSSFSLYTGMYAWSTATLYTQQDGWFKKYAGSSIDSNMGRTSITDEDDPALVHSAVDNNAQPATNQLILVCHPLRNVFTNGVLKAQFDVRQTESFAHSKLYSWFRLMTENDMKPTNSNMIQFPLEVGVSSTRLSGGWRDAGASDGSRTFYTYGNTSPLHWYRYYITCDLESQKSSFEVYDLGTSRIGMDAMPAGSPVVTKTDLAFRKELTAATGGINGIGIRFAFTSTGAYYGAAGYDDGRAYKYDNIKVAWKAPGASSFVECYRNDFSRSMRRTVDGSGELVHNYVPSENSGGTTFTYGDVLVRKASDGTIAGKPYLPAAFGAGNLVQKPGVDGWRFAGKSGYSGPIVLTTNGSNRVAMLTKNAQVLQPMCEDITNGIVKMEWDARMPAGWNGDSYAWAPFFVTSNKGYDEVYDYVNSRYLTLGFSSISSGSNPTTPVKRFSILSSTATTLWDYNTSWESNVKALEWYRFQLFIDMDKTNYWFNVFDVGTSAPATPDSYDTSDPSRILISSATNSLYVRPGNSANYPMTNQGYGIGAFGVISWNNPASDTDYALLFDNVRLWKKGTGDNWNLVFQNDFSTTKRNFARKSVNLMKSSFLDRPEYGEDGWASMPTYNGAVHLMGGNPALCTDQNIYSLVHPIGRLVRSGKLYAQYDVRLPTFWPENMEYFRFQLGGGAMASASTWTSPRYRAGEHPNIRTEFRMGKSGQTGLVDDTTGINNRTAICVYDGNGSGASQKAVHVGNSYVDHWMRVRLYVDMRARKYDCFVYDMGLTHPGLGDADGALVTSWSNLGFTFNDPISYIGITAGRNPSFAAWRTEPPGAVLFDNVRIVHAKQGLVVSIK